MNSKLILFITLILLSIGTASAATLTIYPQYDTYVYQGSPDTNYNTGGYQDLLLTQSATNSAYVFMAFDGSAIPDGSVINSATVSMENAYGTCDTATTQGCKLNAWRADALWYVNTITWNTRPHAVSGTITTSNTFINDYTTVSMDFTNIVRDWQYGSAVNYGVIITMQNIYGTQDTSAYWYASESPSPSSRPKMVIDYTPPAAGYATLQITFPTPGNPIVDTSCTGANADCSIYYTLRHTTNLPNGTWYDLRTFDDNENLIQTGVYGGYMQYPTYVNGILNLSGQFTTYPPGRYHFKLYGASIGYVQTVLQDILYPEGNELYTAPMPVYFTVTDIGTSPPDTINTTKDTYAWNETVTVFGNAQGISDIRIEQGGNVIRDFGNVNGNYIKTANLAPGNYIATMLRNVGGHISYVTSHNFVVTPSGASLSITLLDPGNPNGGTDLTGSTTDRIFAIGDTRNWLGKTPSNWYLTSGVTNGDVRIQASVGYINSSDIVTITSPTGQVSTFAANAYEIAVVVPNLPESIGTWTAKITDSSNSSNTATSTLIAFVFNRYIEPPATMNGSATMSSYPNSVCIGQSTNVTWSVTGITNYSVKMYRVGDTTAPKYNEKFAASGGSLPFSFESPGTYVVALYTQDSTNSGDFFVRSQTTITVTSCGGGTGTIDGTGARPMPSSSQMSKTAQGLIWVFTQIAFYGLLILIGIAVGIVIVSGGTINNGALVFIIAIVATLEAIIGLFDPYKYYILVITWLGYSVYWKFAPQQE